MHARKEGPKWGSVCAQNEAMKNVFTRCHKIIICCCCNWIYSRRYSILMLLSIGFLLRLFLHVQNWFVMLTGVHFLEVKNKPWHTWVYAWFRHRHEHEYMYYNIWHNVGFGPVSLILEVMIKGLIQYTLHTLYIYCWVPSSSISHFHFPSHFAFPLPLPMPIPLGLTSHFPSWTFHSNFPIPLLVLTSFFSFPLPLLLSLLFRIQLPNPPVPHFPSAM